MDIDLLKTYIEQNLSSYDIAKQLKISATTVRYWLRKYNLTTTPIRGRYVAIKDCESCGKKKNDGKSLCGYCQVKKYRHNLKRKCIEYKGSQCEKCGYDKHPAAMHFHHIDPSQKDFSISNAKNQSWNKIKLELDKCELLCANCHAIEHSDFGSVA